MNKTLAPARVARWLQKYIHFSGDGDDYVPKARILVVDDDELVREVIKDFLAESYQVIVARNAQECMRQAQMACPDIALVDYYLPDGNALDLLPKLKALDPHLPVFVLTGHGTINLAVEAIKQGAEQFITKPVELRVLQKMITKAGETQRNRRNQIARTTQKSRYDRNPFLGSSDAIHRFEDEVHRVMGTECPVLIQGETGVGKGVLANWLHHHGPRADEAIVDLNCAGLSRELLDSELFGYEKGAFTGAVSAKQGLLEVAHRGTAFLDEIGDMDPVIQPKLLKVLEEKRLRRLGDVRDRSIDVHLVAATHQDLPQLVADGRFRRDLFYRINTIPLRIPSLRDRREDISVLADHFVAQLQADLGRPHLSLAAEAKAALDQYDWPGNIRELRNVLERAALLAKGGLIRSADLRFQLTSRSSVVTCRGTLEDVEIQHIRNALVEEKGVVPAAARRLGISRSTLYVKIKQYGISHDAQARTIDAAR